MKPSLQSTQNKQREDAFTPASRSSVLPKTDYNFQASFADFSGRSDRQSGPSFRGISAGYFKSEARSYFAVEAAIFGVIVLSAAVPVIESVRGLAQYVYGVL